MFLDLLFFSLVLTYYNFVRGMALKIQQERFDSQRRFTTFLREVFIPMVEKREAAQYPQHGNNNAPPPLFSPLNDWVRL